MDARFVGVGNVMSGGLEMVVSLNKGTPIWTPKYGYGDPKMVPVILGNPHKSSIAI